MRFFTLLLDPDGRGISEDACRSYEAMPRRRGLEYEWRQFDRAAVLTAWDYHHDDSLVIEDAPWIVVGQVRLDNRREVECWAECVGAGMTDLELVLRVVVRHGVKYIPRFLGDFGFVAWDGKTRAGVAASDAFGVRPLYYGRHGGLLTWSSRSEALASSDQYELRFLMELLTSYAAPPGLSVYAGVSALPPASVATFDQATPEIRSYWSAGDIPVEPRWATHEPEAIENCRSLLVESLQIMANRPDQTWAQLSGGLDSSSVVSLTSWLAEQGRIPGPLAGTVTYVDREGTQTDERAYSNAVVARYGLINRTIVDPPMWFDVDYQPIAADQPGLDFHVQPRELRLRSLLREAGGKRLITGYGGDELFASNMLFAADCIAQRRMGAAFREMARLAALRRASFWELAYQNAIVPLLPQILQPRLVRDESPPGSWLRLRAMREYGSGQGPITLRRNGGPRGRKYHHALVLGVQALQGLVHGGILSDAVELRHPLLYRPLVEFALGLPQEVRVKARTSRWILREAVHGILPEQIRTRFGKPDTSDVLVRSFRARYEQLRSLIQNPILADLGLLDPAQLRAAFAAARNHPAAALSHHLALFPTLAVEAWLEIRSGRWPSRGHLSRYGRSRSKRGVVACETQTQGSELENSSSTNPAFSG